MVKNLPAMQETQVQSLGQEDPLEKEMTTHPVFLPGEFHEQSSLVGMQLRHKSLYLWPLYCLYWRAYTGLCIVIRMQAEVK